MVYRTLVFAKIWTYSTKSRGLEYCPKHTHACIMLSFLYLFACLVFFRPIRKFFTNMKTSLLPVKGCKVWPCHPYCQCTIITLSSEEVVLLKHNSLMPLSVAFEEQQKPLEPQHLLCFWREIITSQGYLTLTVLIFRSRARIRILGLVKTWKWLLVVL